MAWCFLAISLASFSISWNSGVSGRILALRSSLALRDPPEATEFSLASALADLRARGPEVKSEILKAEELEESELLIAFSFRL